MLSRDEEVWIRAYEACASCATCREKNVAISWADDCLENFRKRFPVQPDFSQLELAKVPR